MSKKSAPRIRLGIQRANLAWLLIIGKGNAGIRRKVARLNRKIEAIEAEAKSLPK